SGVYPTGSTPSHPSCCARTILAGIRITIAHRPRRDQDSAWAGLNAKLDDDPLLADEDGAGRLLVRTARERWLDAVDGRAQLSGAQQYDGDAARRSRALLPLEHRGARRGRHLQGGSLRLSRLHAVRPQQRILRRAGQARQAAVDDGRRCLRRTARTPGNAGGDARRTTPCRHAALTPRTASLGAAGHAARVADRVGACPARAL